MKTLKDILRNSEEWHGASNWEDFYVLTTNAVKDWLEQKRQEEEKFLPPRFRVTRFIDELLEELK